MLRRVLPIMGIGFASGWIFSGHFIHPPLLDTEVIIAIIIMVAVIIFIIHEDNKPETTK